MGERDEKKENSPPKLYEANNKPVYRHGFSIVETIKAKPIC